MALDTRWHRLIIALVALAACLTSIGNGFAYDDIPIIATNERAHTLSSWWSLFGSSYWPPMYGESLYRPLSMLSYALQWTLGGGNPMVFHAVSIVLFASLAVAVLMLLRELLDDNSALVGSALFAAHPVHTEAVANVVGQAELLAAIGAVGAVILYIRSRRSGGPTFWQASGIAALYTVASLAKEHALFLPLLILAAEFTVNRPAPDVRQRVPGWRLLALLAVIGASVLGARAAVLGSVFGEQSPVEMDASERVWTMFRVVPEWVRLLTFPAHLSAEYGPQQIDIIDAPSGLNMLGIVLVVAIVAAFVASLSRQRTIAFGLAWLTITFLPVSNLLSGVVLQERSLMLPSVGAAMVFGAGFQWLWRLATRPTARQALVAGVGLLTLLGVWRSAVRNPVWRDNPTLLAQTVQDAPRSYRAHYLYGAELFKTGRAREGELELRLAIAHARRDSDPFNFLATKYREAQMYAQAIPLYRQALAIRPRRPDSRFGLAWSLLETGDIAGARVHSDTGIASGQLKSYFEWVKARSDTVQLTRQKR